MTRFTRVKSTHQRVADEPTPWNQLKDTPAKDDTKRHKSFQKPNKKFNNPKSKSNSDSMQSANFTPLGDVKGYGASKSVKIFGNFWVGAEDAKRLTTMAKKLKDEGVPRKDILVALQGERRKAEKASKRRRDKTCFSCRQFGHVLADCPGEKNSGGDICFKCGSTEHTSRFCKRKGEKFSFAKCFICSQSGHISRQCPNNTKGIYPAGGSCDECGAVTHLKKDCPQTIINDDDDTAQIGRISNPFLSTEYEEVMEVEEVEKIPEQTTNRKRKNFKWEDKKVTEEVAVSKVVEIGNKKRRVKF